MLRAFFEALIVGGAALYVWVLASQLHTPLIRPVQRWLRRGWRVSLIGCPWCSGFWLSVIGVLLVQWGRLDWITTPFAILAAAALVGVVGSNFTPGMDAEDDE